MIDTSHTTYARTSNNQKPSGEKDKPKGSRDECARPRVCVWSRKQDLERTISSVFDMPALEGLASEPGSGQPELGPERPVALFDVGVWFEPG
jgi:hypothetical protein